MKYFSDIVSIISLIVSIILAYRLFKLDTKHETRQETSELTTVIIKLENIQDMILDIKNDLVKTKDEVRKDHDAIIRIEENLKQVWKKIEEKVGKRNE